MIGFWSPLKINTQLLDWNLNFLLGYYRQHFINYSVLLIFMHKESVNIFQALNITFRYYYLSVTGIEFGLSGILEVEELI